MRVRDSVYFIDFIDKFQLIFVYCTSNFDRATTVGHPVIFSFSALICALICTIISASVSSYSSFVVFYRPFRTYGAFLFCCCLEPSAESGCVIPIITSLLSDKKLNFCDNGNHERIDIS